MIQKTGSTPSFGMAGTIGRSLMKENSIDYLRSLKKTLIDPEVQDMLRRYSVHFTAPFRDFYSNDSTRVLEIKVSPLKNSLWRRVVNHISPNHEPEMHQGRVDVIRNPFYQLHPENIPEIIKSKLSNLSDDLEKTVKANGTHAREVAARKAARKAQKSLLTAELNSVRKQLKDIG